MTETSETPVERRLRDTAKRMRRIFDAEPEADAIDLGREAIALLREWRAIEDDDSDVAQSRYVLNAQQVFQRILAVLTRCEQDGPR